MSRNHRATAAWLLVSTLAFGLGWMLKPSPTQSDSAASDRSLPAQTVSPAISPLTATKRSTKAVAGETGQAGSVLGSGIALGSTRIEELGRQFKNELDPIARRLAFARLLEGLTLENAAEIRAQIAHMPDGSPEFLEFHYAWGKVAGLDAVMNGMDTRERDMGASLAGWASANPAAAMKWFDGLNKNGDTPNNRDYLKGGMVHGLANTDPDLAGKFIYAMAAAGDKGADQLLGIVTGKVLQSRGAVEAAAWAANLPPGELRLLAMGQVAHDYARKDPEAAAKWASQFAKTEGGARIVGAISNEWAKRDGAAAVGWLESLRNVPGTSQAYFSAFEGWAGKDPLAASEYLVDMARSPARDQAINGLVSRHRWEDPLASVAWASQIGDAKTRVESMVRAGQAYYRRDPASAMDWLALSGLPAEAQKKVVEGSRR